MAKPVVKYGALAGVLILPSSAYALTALSSGTSTSSQVTVTLSATLGGSLLLQVSGRTGPGFVLNTGTDSQNVDLGSVNLGIDPSLAGISRYPTSDGGALFVAPMEVTVTFTGHPGADVAVTGTPSTTGGGAPPVFDARWQCTGASTPSWGLGTGCTTGQPLNATGANCLSTNAMPGSPHSINMDAALCFGPGAPPADYSANFVFTVTAQ